MKKIAGLMMVLLVLGLMGPRVMKQKEGIFVSVSADHIAAGAGTYYRKKEKTPKTDSNCVTSNGSKKTPGVEGNYRNVPERS